MKTKINLIEKINSVAEVAEVAEVAKPTFKVLYREIESNEILTPNQYRGASTFICAIKNGVAIAAIDIEDCNTDKRTAEFEARKILSNVDEIDFEIAKIQTSCHEFFALKEFIHLFKNSKRLTVPSSVGGFKVLYQVW